MIVDRQMHVFPADPSGLALSRPVAGDAVADAIELAQLLDVDVNDLAGRGALITAELAQPARAPKAGLDPVASGRG